jgi:DedD protein
MAEARNAGTQDVETLKRRGRRRLVGAIALVLAAVIVLPMIFDAEPKRAPPVSVRIPSEDDPAFSPKVVPKSPPIPAPAPDRKAAPAPEKKSAPAPETKAAPPPAPEVKPAAVEPKPAATAPEPAPKAEAKPKPAPEKPAAKAEAKKDAEAERKRAEIALAGGVGQFVVPVGAFSTDEKIKEVTGKLAAAKLPHYTEPVATAKGNVTRVRAGPFPSMEAAQAGFDTLKGLGLNPGKPIPR